MHRFTRIGTVIGLALGLWPGSALADVSGTEPFTITISLPIVLSTIRHEPCGPPANFDACPSAAPFSTWKTHCGGMGRIRDLVTYSEKSDEEYEILAVGDGAATITLDPLNGLMSVRPQLWKDNSRDDQKDSLGIVGINSLFYSPRRPGADSFVFAVGERAQILQLPDEAGGGTCWERHDDEVVNNTKIELNSLFVFNNSVGKPAGWAVGRDGNHAEIMVLGSEGGEPLWAREHERVSMPIPPLFDVQTTDGMNAVAIGHDGSQGVFVDLELLEEGSRASIAQTVSGLPEQISLTNPKKRSPGSPGGWAFGSSDSSKERTKIWEQDWDTKEWFDSDTDHGQVLIDAFSTESFGRWFGLIAKNPGDAVLHSLEDEFTADWPPRIQAGGEFGGPSPNADPGGHLAILPLKDLRDAGDVDVAQEHVLYAAGDDVWLADVSEESDVATPAERWTLLQTRRRLVGFAPNGQGGGWALSASSEGSMLFELPSYFDKRLLNPVQTETGSGAMPRLNAIASGGGYGWAVGPNGETWRAKGPRAAWRRERPPEADVSAGLDESVVYAGADDHFLDVDVTPNGVAWASGVGADGKGRLWRWVDGVGTDESGWAEVASIEEPVPLAAVTALHDGGDHVYAVGGNTILFALPDDDCGPAADVEHWEGPTGWMCTKSITFEFEGGDTLDLLDIDAISPRTVWAVSRDYIVRLAEDDWWIELPPEMPSGGHPIAVGLLDESEAVVAYSCCDGLVPDGRKPTNVRRYRIRGDGSPEAIGPAAVVNVPLADVVVERAGRAGSHMWMVGDWTTLIEAEY